MPSDILFPYYIRFDRSNEAEFERIDCKPISLRSQYGGSFDYLEIAVYYEKGILSTLNDVDHYQCQLIISRTCIRPGDDHKLLTEDGDVKLKVFEVYRTYFNLPGIKGDDGELLKPDLAHKSQATTVSFEVAKAAAILYHGVVDELDSQFRRDKGLPHFMEMRESAGVNAFIKDVLSYSERKSFVFEASGFDFEHLTEKDTVVKIGYTLTCCTVAEGDAYVNRISECKQELEWRSDRDNITVSVTIHNSSNYPYISISDMFEKHKDVLKPALRIK